MKAEEGDRTARVRPVVTDKGGMMRGVMRVEVSEADINDGERYSTASCPVALAVKRVMGADYDVGVYASGVSFYPRRANAWARGANIPHEARGFIERFDAGEDVSPFVFNMEVLGMRAHNGGNHVSLLALMYSLSTLVDYFVLDVHCNIYVCILPVRRVVSAVSARVARRALTRQNTRKETITMKVDITSQGGGFHRITVLMDSGEEFFSRVLFLRDEMYQLYTEIGTHMGFRTSEMDNDNTWKQEAESYRWQRDDALAKLGERERVLAGQYMRVWDLERALRQTESDLTDIRRLLGGLLEEDKLETTPEGIDGSHGWLYVNGGYFASGALSEAQAFTAQLLMLREA